MSDNPFDSFNAALKNLASAINENKETLANRLANKEPGIPSFNGQAFAKNVDAAKGSMVSCFCTVCGNKISIHEKMKAGYCEYCGEKIELAPALRGKFQKTALKNINCKDLFEVGEQNNDFDLIKLAAEKGSVDAMRRLAYEYIDDDTETSLQYAQMGKKRNDIDCEFFVIAAKLVLKKYSDKEIASVKRRVDQLQKQKFISEYTYNCVDSVVKLIKLRLDEIEYNKRRVVIDYASLSARTAAIMHERYGSASGYDSYYDRKADGTVNINGQTHNVYNHDAEGYSTGPYIEDAEGYKTAVNPDDVSAPFNWNDC